MTTGLFNIMVIIYLDMGNIHKVIDWRPEWIKASSE
jgi:hypothetical protein